MRILILSDIHANAEALEACLRAAPAYDLCVNLGDVVGYGASPNEVTDRSRELGRLIVRGNHDKACTGLSDLHDFNPIAAAAALWTQEQLTPANLEWLRGIPAGPVELPAEAALPGGADRPLLVHGSPLDEDEYVISVAEALDVLMRSNIRLTFFGHTHVQGGFSLSETSGGQSFRPQYSSRDEQQEVTMALAPGTRYLINPGSIGQPRDTDWRAAFLVYDSAAASVIFHRVPYDIKAAQKKIMDADLPPRLATRLKEGR